MGTIEERVSYCISILDRDYPGWEAKIDLDRLNLKSCINCILGQLFGDFYHAPSELMDVKCGTCSISSSLFTLSDEYPLLQFEWIRRIRERRADHATVR